MSGWPVLPLRDVLRPRNDIVHPRDNPTGVGTFVGLEHIEPQTGRRIGEAPINLATMTGRKARFFPSDIVYGYLRPYLNKVWIAEFSGYCSVDQYVFVVVSAVADTEYVAWYLRSPAYLEAAPIDETPGQLPRIRLDEVLSTPIPLPPLDEQRRTAARLRDQLRVVDALAVAETARNVDLTHLRTRAYEAAFPVTPLSVSAESASPGGWTWRSLSSLGRLESGHTPSRSRPDWWGGDIPWIALPDIRALDGRYAFETLERTNPDGIAHSAARVLPAGTVVLSRTASVGFVTIMGRPMATSQDFVNWVCGPDLDPEFLMHLFVRSRERFRSLSAGAVHKTVYYPTAKALRVCAPPLDEQRRIAAKLREQLVEIDRAKSALETQRVAIDALPAALLREVFGDAAEANPGVRMQQA